MTQDALYKFNVATEEEAKRNLIPPSPPTQGEEETARDLMSKHRLQFHGQFSHERIDARTDFHNDLAAALRQRADEATRAENEACAVTVETYYAGDIAKEIAKSIRARITP